MLRAPTNSPLRLAVWVLVAMWRCAFNVNWRGWGYIVRGILILTVIGFFGALYIGFSGGFADA